MLCMFVLVVVGFSFFNPNEKIREIGGRNEPEDVFFLPFPFLSFPIFFFFLSFAPSGDAFDQLKGRFVDACAWCVAPETPERIFYGMPS